MGHLSLAIEPPEHDFSYPGIGPEIATPPADSSEETFRNSPVSPRQPIRSNFRVLARTNMILRADKQKPA
jgi:hypothetical protein